MANTYVDYTADALQTEFLFNFPYLEDEHVTVFIDGARQTIGVDEDYTVQTSPSKRIVLNVAATGGEIVRVRRISDPATDLVDFVNGSVLTETELDRAYLHNRYLAEESAEQNDVSLRVKEGGAGFDGLNKRLLNLSDPVDNQDAATKSYVDTNDALKVSKSGDSMSGNLAMGSNKITGLSNPSDDQDAATKDYVDDVIGNVAVGALPDDSVTYAKIQEVAGNNVLLGNDNGTNQNVQELTAAEVRTVLNVADGATANTGTVTSVGSGTGLTGGPITGSGTLSIANGGVDEAQLANNAVTTDKIEDGAVTSIKTNFSYLEVGDSTVAYIDLKTPGTDDYDARVISQADSATLVPEHESRVRLESSSQLGLVAGADPSTATPGPEVVTIKETEVVVNEQGGDVDFRVEGDTATALITTDAANNKVTLGDAGVTLNFANLPTSSAGLVSGDVWNNSGVLNIVP